MSDTNKSELAAMEYADWTAADADKQAQVESERKAAEGKFYKLTEGTHRLRVLPARKGSQPIRAVTEHHVSMPGLKHGVRIVCPRAEKQLPCRVCAQAQRWAATGNPADSARAEEIGGKTRWYINAIVRGQETAGPKIVGLSYTVYQRLMHFRRTLNVNFPDPMAGVDIVISRVGMGAQDTKYTVDLDPNGKTPLSLDDEEAVQWLVARHDLEAQGEVLSDSDIAAKLSGNPGGKGGASAPTPALPAGKRAQNMLGE